MNQLKHYSGFDPIDDLFRGFFVRPVDFNLNDGRQNTALMRVDISEKADDFIICADLPGVKKENINVNIEGNVVVISAEINYQNDENQNEQKLLQQERYSGKFSRSFQLPEEIDDNKAQAKFTDGVLSLTLPKKQNASSKKLEIN